MKTKQQLAITKAVRGLPREVLGDLGYSTPVQKRDALRQLEVSAPEVLASVGKWTRARLVALLGELGLLTDAEDRRELVRMLKCTHDPLAPLYDLVELALDQGEALAAEGGAQSARAPLAWSVACADCRDYLATLPDESVDAVVTDGPYELGFMGQKWDSSGISYDPVVWSEVLRVLKPGGHVVAFAHSRTYHRLAVAVEDAGHDIRDSLAWLYGTGFPKSTNMALTLGPDYEGVGTALSPAHEPAVLARKPFKGTVADNCDVHLVGGLDAAAASVPREKGKRGWPSNVVHDGSPEALSIFPSSRSGARKAGKYGGNVTVYNHAEPREQVEILASSGSAARFFYCAKVAKGEREAGLGPEFALASAGELTGGRAEGSAGLKSPRAGAGRTSSGRRNTHKTVKPIALMRWLVRLVTPFGGVVLDPFTGSGSTGCAAVLEGRDFLGCELSEEYAAIARARIEHHEKKRE